MQKILFIIGTLSAILSVAIGAFGAHGLKKTLELNNRMDVFDTAVKYQFFHTFAIFITAFLMDKYSQNLLNYSGYAFILGIVIFSGSLYILSITNTSFWGAITPIGGLLFIAGWGLMLAAIIK